MASWLRMLILAAVVIILAQAAYASQVRVTYYYTPSEYNFNEWSRYGCGSSIDCCNINRKGFYEDVRCQGSGLGKDGCLYRYYSIGITRDASARICEPGKELRGVTATGTNPAKKRTIAVDPKVVPLGKTVVLNFGENECAKKWNGCYMAEDTGSAIKGQHVDLYVGVGKKELTDSSCLPSYADLEVKECNPEIKPEPGKPSEKEQKPIKELDKQLDVKYSMKPSFRTKVGYDLFGRYAGYSEEAKTSTEKVRECLRNGNGLEGCRLGNIKKIEETSDGTLIRFSAEEDSFSLFRKSKIIVKFAIMAEDIVPPPMVEGLKITNNAPPAMPSPAQNSGKYAVLSWEKSQAGDTGGYFIYHSKNDF